MQGTLTDIDPFDLPEWLGTGGVVWRADEGLQTGHLVRGRLAAEPAQTSEEPEEAEEMVCDLLAVDEAYPSPVVDDASRLRVHQAWRHGQVVIGEHGGHMVLAVPGTRFDPELVLEALGRFARAVGARAERYAVLLRLG